MPDRVGEGPLPADYALVGFELTEPPRGLAHPHLKSGDLVEALGDWLPPFSGYHLYYPSRRQMTPAFTVVLNALRYKPSVRPT